MEEFIMLLKSLHNVDGYCLEPEFGQERQAAFCRDPVHHLLVSDQEHRERIWQEVLKRHERSLAMLPQRRGLRMVAVDQDGVRHLVTFVPFANANDNGAGHAAPQD
jgi:hypothetical protein